MTKTDLVSKMAQSASINKTQAEKAINAMLDGIKDALAKEEKVTLVGFGTFSAKKRAARKGRNPQTGKEINIPAKVVPKFSPGKDLKDRIN